MRRYKVRLDSDEINQLAAEIDNYKKTLLLKCQTFISRLSDEGIAVASVNVGGWTTIMFSKTVMVSNNGASGSVTATSCPILVQWLVGQNDVRSAWVSPLLMAEFGSGKHASDASGQPNASWAGQVGAGRGTFPDQTHAFEDKWSWKDLDGEWHESEGEEPTMPIYKAATRMRARIDRIAWEVFHT